MLQSKNNYNLMETSIKDQGCESSPGFRTDPSRTKVIGYENMP